MTHKPYLLALYGSSNAGAWTPPDPDPEPEVLVFPYGTSSRSPILENFALWAKCQSSVRAHEEWKARQEAKRAASPWSGN